MTIAEALSEPDLRLLRGIIGSHARSATPSAMLEQLRALMAASQAVLVERSDGGHAIVGISGSPPIEPPYGWLQRVVDRGGDDHAATISLPAGSGREAWLVFLRDRAVFTEADRVTLALLRPHLAAAYRRATERPDPALTARQREILRLVARGYRNEEIARRLVLSVGTVRKHLNNIYQQLGVSSRAAAVARVFADSASS